MRPFLIIILFSFTALISNGQINRWAAYNDSVFKYMIDFFSNRCTDLNSNRPVSKRQIKEDIRAIKMVNKLYNGVETIQDLELIKRQCKKCSDKADVVDTLLPVYLYRSSNGNLRFIFKGAQFNDTIIKKRIQLLTDTKTGCQSKYECCLCYFDFIYVKNYLLKYIQFPMSIYPGTEAAIVGSQ